MIDKIRQIGYEILRFFEFEREQLRLPHDLLLCGTNNTKYNNKYYFLLESEEGNFILDRASLKIMAIYSHSIEALNYMALSVGAYSFNGDRALEGDHELVETMRGLNEEDQPEEVTQTENQYQIDNHLDPLPIEYDEEYDEGEESRYERNSKVNQ